MASEASWQTSHAGGESTAFSTDQPMDQRSVETLLRRLVERVEDTERRYGEALDELHARLDQLSQTTEAARETGAPENSDSFDRLHAHVSDLARRLDQDTSTPLDDFERLGKALSGALHGDLESDFDGDTRYPASEPYGYAPEPSPFAQAAMGGNLPGEQAPGGAPSTGYPDFGYSAPEPNYPPREETCTGGTGDLDKRLVEMAQRLEDSIGTAMPTGAIEALNTRLDEIGGQLSQALETAPTRAALEHVERQISDMGQQVTRAEEQLGKVAGIEAHLIKLIARLDEKAAGPAPQVDPAQLEEIASKAATDAARLVAADAKQTTERLDAMHRDLTAMSDKGRESGDRLVSTLEAVHESLKQLVQQVERGSPALQAKQRPAFLERARQAETKPAPAQAKAAMPQPRPSQTPAGDQPAGEPAKTKTPMPQERPPEPVQSQTRPSQAAPANGTPQGPAKSDQAKGDQTAEPPVRERTLRDRLGAAIPDFKETETPPPFGRAKRLASDDEAVDLDAAMPPRSREGQEAEHEAPDDLVAAARRAAQAAALRAEERGGRRSSSPLPGSASAEQPGRRKRSLLIVAAAVLLALSALLLYARLGSKPDATAPEMEQVTPAPGNGAEDMGTDDMTAPGSESEAPAAEPEKSGSWEPTPNTGDSPADSAASDATGFTEMAKSSGRVSTGRIPPMPASELTPEPQLASLTPSGASAMPVGVTFSIEDPAFGPNTTQSATPAQLPLPPEALGPLALREAAAKGDAAAQYTIAIRYADGVGTKADPKEAAKWLEYAAAAGLAPAQYRLAAMYESGLGVAKDSNQARTWYAAAAEKGNVKAMHNLAVSVSGRDGGDPDYALAAKWYGEAASYGLADSQFNLGILAEHGLGMTKNLSEAYKWFALAAAHGDAEAAKRREVIRVQLAPDSLAKAEATVKAWKARVAPMAANEVAEQQAWAAKAPATRNASLVSRAQTLLNALGYDVGPPDGLVGSRTRSAVKLFQRRNGLTETGEISIPLVTQLERLSS